MIAVSFGAGARGTDLHPTALRKSDPPPPRRQSGSQSAASSTRLQTAHDPRASVLRFLRCGCRAQAAPQHDESHLGFFKIQRHLAQWLERTSYNPRDPGSNPGGAHLLNPQSSDLPRLLWSRTPQEAQAPHEAQEACCGCRAHHLHGTHLTGSLQVEIGTAGTVDRASCARPGPARRRASQDDMIF